MHIVSAPSVPVYVNLDYHFVELGEVAAYLRRHSGRSITVHDGLDPAVTIAALVELFLDQPQLVVFHVTIENAPDTARLIGILRSVSERTQVAVYGRGAFHGRRLFEGLDVDWIVLEQDWECALLEIARGSRTPVAGSLTRAAPHTYVRGPAAITLDGRWELPALDLLPVSSYGALPDDESYAPGSESAPDFAIGISRGCDHYCGYCPIPDVMGRREVFRQDLPGLARYLEAARDEYGFGSVSLFGANFTASPEYVRAFCEHVPVERTGLTWKVVTSTGNLDRDLVARMGDAGCTRIAIGIESLRTDGSNRFSDRIGAARLAEIGRMCADAGVSLVCFMMIGLPGQSRAEAAFTLRAIDDAGGIPRPMTYVNFREVQKADSFDALFWANRKATNGERDRGDLTSRDTTLAVHDWRRWLAEIA